jgi:hypothetical protein
MSVFCSVCARRYDNFQEHKAHLVKQTHLINQMNRYCQWFDHIMQGKDADVNILHYSLLKLDKLMKKSVSGNSKRLYKEFVSEFEDVFRHICEREDLDFKNYEEYLKTLTVPLPKSSSNIGSKDLFTD